MKFAVISGIFNVGVRTHVAYLLGAGHHVDLFFESPVSHDLSFLEPAWRSRLRVFAPPALATRSARLVDAAGRLSLSVLRAPRVFALALGGDERRFHSRGSLNCLAQVISRVPRNKPEYDVVHCHSAAPGRRAALLIEGGFLAGKLVVAFKGMDATVIAHRQETERYRRMFVAMSAATVQTEFLRRVVEQLGAPPEKIVKIPTTIAFETIPQKDSIAQEASSQRLELLTVARLIELKGIRYAIAAVRELVVRGFDVHYTVVGEGPLDVELRAHAKKMGIGDRVTFLGRLAQREVYRQMARSDLFLMPGIVDEEGGCEAMGLVNLEAQVVGLPVIASRVGGMPETLAPEGSGVLVEPGNVDALVDAVVDLINRRDEWPAMVERGRRHAWEHFSIERVAQQFDVLYERLSTVRNEA